MSNGTTRPDPVHLGRFLAMVAILLLAACTARGPRPEETKPLQTIPALDIPRYMGVWYEVAKYPNHFQTQCAGGTSATYSPQPEGRVPEGRVKVVNRCQTKAGGWDEVVGEARQVGGSGSAKLEVRFAPAWLSWLPMVWGQYWVIDLDPEYQLAAVSEPSRTYLWILSRTPVVAPEAYRSLLDRLREQGFDLSRLEASGP